MPEPFDVFVEEWREGERERERERERGGGGGDTNTIHMQ